MYIIYSKWSDCCLYIRYIPIIPTIEQKASCIPIQKHAMCGPLDKSWFINPMNTMLISTINHSEIGVMFTSLAIINQL